VPDVEDAVIEKCHELARAVIDQGIVAAKAKGWRPKPGAKTHDQAIDLLQRAVPLAMDELRDAGVL
jgi:hypothetical protein